MITWITHPEYDIPLPPGHRFTSTKFSDLFELLKKSEYIGSATISTRKGERRTSCHRSL